MATDAQPIDLGILLALGWQEFVRELRAALDEQGFTDQGRSDGYVLRALSAAPMTVSDLAVRLEITKQGAGQIVDDMEARGYVERRPDPSDKRARLLHLSAHGQAALAAAREFHRRYEKRLVREHGAAAVRGLRDLLTAMAGPAATPDPRLRALYT
ncbi:Transcriptional regulator, MarR family [Alloactinosynnema sp. L-07]|uniref:MarR family winged helix-turn-helix transcriptional regulator n=1 Tax=Alloactinosynnema sp. L-07 TaxID=1653480 RepID=UPI00065EFA03|nr:MarR family transcriptional regulator [Alloactinosynnema sp. L-07]CRK58789.1 Transcriptional regulator, MarR family [Alloactinosynnema sp. L-07]